MTPEGEIKKQIREYLISIGWFLYPNTANEYSLKGVPDYTAIDQEGNVIQIEVKTPKGKQSLQQKEFEKLWTNHHGIYIIVHSLEELRLFLYDYNRR